MVPLISGVVLLASFFYWRHRLGIAQETIRLLEEANQVLQELALHDKLTGLPNRGLFEDRLQQAIEKASRAESQFAILFIDLDGFKLVNDAYGHDIGDMLLIEVANRFRHVIRDEDTVARLGGDEFIVLVQITDPGNAVLVADKLIAAISEPFILGQKNIRISASVGSAVYPVDGTTLHDLIKRADDAMYGIKRIGRNGAALPSEPLDSLALK
ncbi:GGDEF domain-containing protein [Herbaspirillum sp. RV1423]|uniref:GGDEF domain-containing protein n=1 Tax=Herbaspirillum sp. RV1423 TaxID=1443993 RepID=UPI0004B7CC93|nr:GGDEF domain-containing protein [Herbaspirillum sp. RV1423]